MHSITQNNPFKECLTLLVLWLLASPTSDPRPLSHEDIVWFLFSHILEWSQCLSIVTYSAFHAATGLFHEHCLTREEKRAGESKQEEAKRESERQWDWFSFPYFRGHSCCICWASRAIVWVVIAATAGGLSTARQRGTGCFAVTMWQQEPWVIKAALCSVPSGQVCLACGDHTWLTHIQDSVAKQQFSTLTNSHSSSVCKDSSIVG